MASPEQIIAKLDLKPLPGEGGFYKETYKSAVSVDANSVGIAPTGNRAVCTAIYYLVDSHSFSSLHRLKGDEIFHFYAGDAVEMVQIDPQGNLKIILLGSNILAGETPQILVPAGTWQGSKLKTGGKWALLGNTNAPGFEFEDFELGKKEDLLKQFPQHKEIITQYLHK
jgi:predicted cupin superfamily sugar epimerase